MTHVLTIAGREIRERRMVFIAALFIAVMPFFFAVLPTASRFSGAAKIAGAGGILAPAWAIGLAIILGVSMMSSELAQRRLSFLLTKPVGAASVWFGKLTGAWVMVLVTFGIVLIPSLIAGGWTWETVWSTPISVVVTLTALISLWLILIFHLWATFVRSRSPRLAVDLVLGAIFAGATWLLMQPLVVRLSLENAKIVVIGVVAGFAAIIIPAGVYQVARGRADFRASHAALSKFVWIASVAMLLLAAGFVAWILSATPSDVLFPQLGQAPSGKWAWVSGEAAKRNDYHPLFLIDTSTGRHFSIPASRFGPAFSRDGKSFVWLKHGRGAELMVTRLDGAKPRHMATGLMAWFASTTLSDDGTRLAVINPDRTLSVTEVESGRILASVKVNNRRHRMFFAGNDTLRIYETPDDGPRDLRPVTLRAHELNIAARKLAPTGEFTTPAKSLLLTADSNGARLLVVPIGADRMFLLDGRSLATVTELPVRPTYAGAFILANGNVVLADRTAGFLRVFDDRGSKLREIRVGDANHIWTVSEIAPSRLLVLLHGSPGSNRPEVATLVVDCERGVIERREKVMPGEIRGWEDPRVASPSAPRQFLVMDVNRVLWRWDPMTGAKTRLD